MRRGAEALYPNGPAHTGATPLSHGPYGWRRWRRGCPMPQRASLRRRYLGGARPRPSRDGARARRAHPRRRRRYRVLGRGRQIQPTTTAVGGPEAVRSHRLVVLLVALIVDRVRTRAATLLPLPICHVDRVSVYRQFDCPEDSPVLVVHSQEERTALLFGRISSANNQARTVVFLGPEQPPQEVERRRSAARNLALQAGVVALSALLAANYARSLPLDIRDSGLLALAAFLMGFRRSHGGPGIWHVAPRRG